jgi:hypothetical protein
VRTGSNPAKDQPELPPYGRHRIIVPIYVPALTGYFEHALETLELCLDSLRHTASGRATITLIANQCAPEVLRRLEEHRAEGWVDQLVINRTNRGKVDSVVSAVRGSFEELITLSDSDFLFVPGWLEAVEQIFAGFPECGAASPFPTPHLAFGYTAATLWGAWLKGELAREAVVDEADFSRFEASIQNPWLFNPEVRSRQLVVKRGGLTVCVGCDHSLFTMHRRVVGGIPPEAALRALGMERQWLDEPPDRLGFWRLSSARAYAYHMGNSPEEWMYAELERSREAPESVDLARSLAAGFLAPRHACRAPLPFRRYFLRLYKALVRKQFLELSRRKLRGLIKTVR